MNFYKILILILVFIYSISAQNKFAKIKYISTDFIYVDAGTSSGIELNDSLFVLRDGKEIAVIKIVYAAGYSASGKQISGSESIKINDLVLLPQKTPESEVANIPNNNKSRERTFSTTLNVPKSKSITRTSGSLVLQSYWIKDMSNADLDYNQPSASIKIKSYHLANIKDLNIRLRFRSRYDNRSRRLGTNIAKTDWRNRLYEAALEYGSKEALLNLKLGRIHSNAFSGIGFIDGALAKHNLSENFGWGLFAGTQPEWQYSGYQTSLQKYGLFLNYLRGDYSSSRFETNLSLSGVYHNSTISRELVFLQSSWQPNDKFNIYGSSELDINRGWRESKSGEKISLSGLYLSSRYKINSNLSASLSFDSRRNYYFYEIKSLADSLFDAAFRQGARLGINYSFLENYNLYANIGIRKRQDESASNLSWSLRVNKRQFFFRRLLLSLNLSGFENHLNSGNTGSIKLSKSFNNGAITGISYGAYLYQFDLNNSKKQNYWLRFNTSIPLLKYFYFNLDYEYDFGDDFDGQRILTGFGYYF